MTTETQSISEKQFPDKPFIAGFWLIAMLPIAIVIVYPLTATDWIHRQGLREMIGIPLLTVIFGSSAYLWANALVRRSGWGASWRTGLAGTIGLIVTIMVVYLGFESVFSPILKLLRITKTEDGTRNEFLAIFVIWTGIVTGGCGLAVGLSIKQIRLALKMLGIGFLCGMAVFFVIALGMELIGFRVGTSRPDSIPSMPVVTLLGIWVTALIGSEVFGRLLALQRHFSHKE